jgi:hypothetical protein
LVIIFIISTSLSSYAKKNDDPKKVKLIERELTLSVNVYSQTGCLTQDKVGSLAK